MKNKSDEEILKNMAVNNLYDLYLLADARADRVQSQLTEARSLNEKLANVLEDLSKRQIATWYANENGGYYAGWDDAEYRIQQTLTEYNKQKEGADEKNNQ